MGRLSILTRRVAVINPGVCRRCNLCVKACPLSALDPPAVNHRLCVGCGLCVSACPFAAIQVVEKTSVGALVALVLLVALFAAAVYFSLSISPVYQTEASVLNFISENAKITYTPTGAPMPTGDEAAGAGSGFG